MYLFTCAVLISQIHNTRRSTKINLLFIAHGGRFSGGIYSTAHSLFFFSWFYSFSKTEWKKKYLAGKII